MTALHFASRDRQRENILSLLYVGAHTGIRSSKGFLAQDMTQDQSIRALFDLPINEINLQFAACINLNENEILFAKRNPFQEAIVNNDENRVRLLLEQRRATLVQLEDGFRFGLSCTYCKAEILQLFIGQIENNTMYTILHFEINQLNQSLKEARRNLARISHKF